MSCFGVKFAENRVDPCGALLWILERLLLAEKAFHNDVFFDPEYGVIRASHAYVSDEASPVRQNTRVCRWNMGMRPVYDRGSAIGVVTEGALLAREFRMQVDDEHFWCTHFCIQRIESNKRAGQAFIMHRKLSLETQNEQRSALCFYRLPAEGRNSARVIRGTGHRKLSADVITRRIMLAPEEIASGKSRDARFLELGKRFFCDAFAVREILNVRDHRVSLIFFPPPWQHVSNSLSSDLRDDIAEDDEFDATA